VSTDFENRLKWIRKNPMLLKQIGRGIEKESLRINSNGHLSQSPHPQGLGSALTHSSITTDYSEALLEFITPVSHSISDTLKQLDDIHRYVYGEIGEELLWSASMPCILEGDNHIPVAQYGTSNIARMKTVYRNGLGHRYGRLMQTISGIHYNFSMPKGYWPLAQQEERSNSSPEDFITESYFRLIRNFRRYSWLLIFLFGASPAVCKSFLRGNTNHQLEEFDDSGSSLHTPYGTALRMGGLGYQSDAQQNLAVCYNTLDSYIETLTGAITSPHPSYENIETKVDGEYQQLNTSLLQIENEFYSPIRPKRVAKSGEIALGALARGGTEYIEVRCIDVNPYLPTGIDAQQIRFLDSFLLFCLMSDSPECNDNETAMIEENFNTVINRGRQPGLKLNTDDGPATLTSLGQLLLDDIAKTAGLLDSAHGGSGYRESLQQQREKLKNPALTPSAKILADMEERKIPFFKLAMEYTLQWSKQYRNNPLNEEMRQEFQQAAKDSIEQQYDIEKSDSIEFEEFLKEYFQQYRELI
jgi:glutamate--cysteine ligase